MVPERRHTGRRSLGLVVCGSMTLVALSSQGPGMDGATPAGARRVASHAATAAGGFRFSSPNYSVRESAGSLLVTIMRAGMSTDLTSVSYTTVDATAVAAVDYESQQGTLTFLPGDLRKTFTVPIVGDEVVQGSRTFLLRLTEAHGPGAEIGAPETAAVAITDDDAGGRIRFSSATYSVSEGAGSVKLTLKRTGGMARGVSVPYSIVPAAPVPATDGLDYDSAHASPPGGVVTFSSQGAGATTQTITIPILQDTLPEGAEAFKVTLGTPVGAVLASPSEATVTIVDDEPTVEFSATSFSAKESQPSALVSVKRSGPPMGVVTVSYGTGGGTATAGSDYKAVSGTLTFGSGVTTRTFTVPLLKDSLVEGPETVGLTLSDPVGIAPGGRSTATLTIVDDDATPTLQFSAATYKASEAMPKAAITVKRAGSAARAVTVDYAVTGGSATNGGVDYDLPTSGTLTFAKGVTTRTIVATVVNDTLDEGTETVELLLQNAQDVEAPGVSPVAIGAQSTAELDIIDNETTVQFTSATYAASEAAKGLTLGLRRTGDMSAESVVRYDVTGGTATNGADYSLTTPGLLTFSAGQSMKTIPIVLDTDTVSEGSETIDLALSDVTGAQVGTPGTAVVTISDNDPAGSVQFSASDYSAAENGGVASITVIRSGGASSDATVHYSTSNGTASAPGNYTTTSGSLSFGAGVKTLSFGVPVVDDGVAGTGALSVQLSLDTPGNGLALGSTTTATLWILDVDAPPPPPPPDVVIEIVANNGTMSFSPSPASLQAGQTVAWHNAASMTHTATQDGGGFDTGPLTPGQTSATFVITTTGSLAYHCAIHPSMTGALSVSP